MEGACPAQGQRGRFREQGLAEPDGGYRRPLRPGAGEDPCRLQPEEKILPLKERRVFTVGRGGPVHGGPPGKGAGDQPEGTAVPGGQPARLPGHVPGQRAEGGAGGGLLPGSAHESPGPWPALRGGQRLSGAGTPAGRAAGVPENRISLA